MGVSFDATCRACKHRWYCTEGGGMVFVQVVCGTCGSMESLPRHAPDDTPPPMSKSALRDYVKGGGGEWSDSGRFFTSSEQELLQRMFAHCGCGGNLYPEGHKRARVRCPECASSDVERGDDEALID